MIKRISPHNLQTTPFIAVKSWELFNTENDSVILLEESPDIALAMDYVDYYSVNPILNSECDIALEQQAEDILIYQEGLSGSGKFYPESEPTNPDGTYKRLVYNTIYKSFYNNYDDPTKIFGVEYIDFPLGKTLRNIADDFRVFNIPQLIYGDKIVPGTVKFFDTSLDDNVTITDDGYQNLIAGSNLFSKIQEIRNFGNTLLTGSWTASCPPYGALSITQPQDVSAYVGTSISFSIVATGRGPIYYQWQSGSTYLTDGVRITGSNSSSLTINNLQLSDSGSYRILVNNAFLGITSSYAQLHVNTIHFLNKTFNIACYSASYIDSASVVEGTLPYTYNISGTLPTGLNFNTTTGEIYGTSSVFPTSPVIYNIQLQVTDSLNTSASQVYYISASYCGIWDSFETYAIGSNLNGLNDGYGFGVSWKYLNDNTWQRAVVSYEDFEAYITGSSLLGMNSGSGFSSSWNVITDNTWQRAVVSYEDFEAYSNGNNLIGLNSGSGFSSSWNVITDNTWQRAVVSYEDFEAYSNGDNLNGLNNGIGFSGPWKYVNIAQLIVEDFEAYTIGNNVNGLNNGIGFSGPWKFQTI